MSRLRILLTPVRRICPSAASVVRFLTGLAVGVLLLVALSRIRLAFGGTAAVDLAIALSICAAFAIRVALLRIHNSAGWILPLAGLLLAAGWGLVGPVLSEFAAESALRMTLESLSARGVQFAIILLAALCGLTPLVLGASFALAEVGRPGSARRANLNPALTGIALCWFVLPVCGGLGMEFSTLSWVAAGCLLALAAAGGSFGVDGFASCRDDVADRQEVSWTFSATLAVMCGAGLAVVMFLARQLIPQNLISEFALGASLLCGVAWARSGPLLNRERKRPVTVQAERAGPETVLPLLLAAWVSLLISGYPLWTDLSLWTNAWVSHTALLFAARGILLVLLAGPLGFFIGRLVRRDDHHPSFLDGPPRPAGSHPQSWISALVPFGVVLGYALAFGSGLHVTTLSLLLILLGLSLAAASWLSEPMLLPGLAGNVRSRVPGGAERQLPTNPPWRLSPVGRLRQAALGSALLMAFAGLFLTGNFTPERSERLLFSTNTFLSLRHGVKRQWLPWLDDGRLIGSFGTMQNRWSLWKHRGAQVLVRKNGISTEFRSTEPTFCPQSAAEILPAVLPLVLHPGAEHVLVVGMHTATLETCHAWPLRSVTTVEDDPAAHEMLASMVAARTAPAALTDPKFRYVAASPLLALAARHPIQYDLILSPQVHVVTLEGTARITRRFYERVHARLSDEGIFCQRIPYYDLGPEAVRQITATLEAVFPQVLVVDSVPGEFLFIGTRREHPLIDTQLVERLQTPQSRFVLGLAGWDWSGVMSRGGLDQESVREFLGEGSSAAAGRPGIPAASGSSILAFSLPREVARWGNKAEATRAALGQYGKSLGSYLGDVPETQEISQRLEDLRLTQQILKEHPDQPWAYRVLLRKQLKERPRSRIVQVRNEGLKRRLHPEDQRRKDYLLALGMAATQEHPSVEDIRSVVKFAAPFDPLLTLFVHHEVAHLLTRAAAESPPQQLHHTLHTIYFASAQDRSVRNVCAAITLLCREPNACPVTAQRWDHLNGLLEIMRQRWNARIAQGSGRSKYEPVDTDRSVQAVEDALATMNVLYGDAGLSRREWNVRRDVLEESLLRPLRQYRSEQFRKYPVKPREG